MNEYDRILNELNTDIIANYVIYNNYGKSIDEIIDLIQLEYIKHTSTDWFSNEIVYIYPSINKRHAKKRYQTINEILIYPNQPYLDYSALLLNLSTKTKYILRPSIKFEVGSNTPSTIGELEQLERDNNTSIGIQKVLSKNKRRTI